MAGTCPPWTKYDSIIPDGKLYFYVRRIGNMKQSLLWTHTAKVWTYWENDKFVKAGKDFAEVRAMANKAAALAEGK